MVQGGTNNEQEGIFMDNGSGGFYSDLVFNGGNYGMFVGNQQFTTRNLTFNNCNTGVSAPPPPIAPFLSREPMLTPKCVGVHELELDLEYQVYHLQQLRRRPEHVKYSDKPDCGLRPCSR